ncbi:tyrosine-protein phosphatase 69D [Drosophila novamexicana]|uniref:tyrosine-protein phosphatase 69D n=1 Tax=Drosophila novamexicana TaxID=47314 RepID=UPI0011E5BA6E|nr:tyrosine-protein phosphatase 69D [Drosophila novamexicana]
MACFYEHRIDAYVILILFLFTNLFAQGYSREWVEVGRNSSLECASDHEPAIWIFNNDTNYKFDNRFTTTANIINPEDNDNENISNDVKKYKNILYIHDVKISDSGNYTCKNPQTNASVEFNIQPFLQPKIIESTVENIKRKIKQSAIIYCVFEIYPQNTSTNKQLKWLKDGSPVAFIDDYTSVHRLSDTQLNFTLEFTELYKKENGTYKCVLYGDNEAEIISKEITLLVMEVPQISIDYAKAVGASKIYLNWTVNDGNDPIQKYFIQYSQEGSPTFKYYKDIINGNNTSCVLDSFSPNTTYHLRITGKNSIGNGSPYQYPFGVTTLDYDPTFIPKVETTGSTASTITIGWSPPSQELIEYIQYYELTVSESGDVPKLIEKAIYQQNSRNLPYMFDKLKTATDYEFQVRACSDLTKTCGPWSEKVNGTTMDGVSTKPTNLKIHCNQQNISRLNSISISWNVPQTPNGKIISYLIILEGNYTYYNQEGMILTEKWGPKIRRVDEPSHKTIYEGVSPNTNYTVTVSAITRHKKNGEAAVTNCFMPISTPETIGKTMWTKVKNGPKYVLKLYLPKISERNGPICCYRLYLVKIINGNNELPTPDKLDVATYNEMHNNSNIKTNNYAYIAEMLSNRYFKSEIFLGDEMRFINKQEDLIDNDKICRKCLEGAPFLRKQESALKIDSALTPAQIQKEQLKVGNLTDHALQVLESRMRIRRNPTVGIEKEQTNISNPNNIGDIYDGEIDINANYTGFLEIIVRSGSTVLMAYSDYFDVITPATEAEQIQSLDDTKFYLNIGIKAVAIAIGFIVIFIIFWIIHHQKTKNAMPDEDTLTLRDSLRTLFRRRINNHSQFIGSGNQKGFDTGPIHKTDLVSAYKNRHKDTDYGFLREYEMLPNRFTDRTTKNSDMKENACKNRYPDIKAYDQTRVKLSPINGNQCTDYINANFVIGYKERKKFICAQGPMETTINDFWRMIWEQHLEIIVMLTNLEEYNKSKCAKYWPEKVFDSKQFGDISVKFTAERKTGDYIIRSLDVTKSNLIGDEEDHRQITQYHYLTWKDFMAPEHPHGIIKFIRQINSVYSVQRGPILVHCSAGVGRTGTLVALDSLVQQLEEENMVSIFNTVCDLRHQRNFLVQSLKQYIFLYRALLDTATYGNTDISLNLLPSTIESLKFKPNEGKCLLEIEFEKLINTTDEINKSCSVGETKENMLKNRSHEIIPYDRNRVILSPIPTNDNSTYINASFIEGYDNTESFIIAQDPMENTIGDFWRMISEQSVSTLIMISEIGDGPRKCPRYWADDEIQYDQILVKYVHSESCPYYTRREFYVTNCKIDDTLKVTQFQYNGWPTVDGEVPEVCRGIIELVDQAHKHYKSHKNTGCRSPLTVHCSLGTDRSSIFVAMCILVQHLRLEKSVDICSTTRKLRSQRPGLLNSFAQYEFLHRAILNYSDLHKLSENIED